MPEETVALAPIPLARAPGRLLFVPLVLLGAGIVAVVAGVVVSGLAGVGLVAAGVVVVVLAVYLALVLFTMRLDVEVAMLRLSWIGGERRYTLSRGAVTRVPLHGAGAASIRPRFGAIGWAMGPAMLRRVERIELVRLARSAALILVPTNRGRLAIAPASEQQLLTALGAAARVQQRLDEVALRARAAAPAAGPAAPGGPPRALQEPPRAETHVLTGIERALLEERLAAERAAALAAAEAERQAALEIAAAQAAAAAAAAEAAAAGLTPEGPALAPAPGARPAARLRQRTAWHRPAWMRAPSIALPRPAIPPLSAEQAAPFVIASLPLLGAVAIWVAAALVGRLDLPAPELRPISLALVASGPLAALGALVARTWFPRLLGLVVVSAVAALVLVGRALLG